LQLLLLMVLVVKPSPYRWVLWPPIACINCYCYFYTPGNDDPNDEGLHRCVSIIYAFVASDFILLTDVQRELRMVDQHELISNSGLWSRLKWGAKLFFGARGYRDCWGGVVQTFHVATSLREMGRCLQRSQILGADVASTFAENYIVAWKIPCAPCFSLGFRKPFVISRSALHRILHLRSRTCGSNRCATIAIFSFPSGRGHI